MSAHDGSKPSEVQPPPYSPYPGPGNAPPPGIAPGYIPAGYPQHPGQQQPYGSAPGYATTNQPGYGATVVMTNPAPEIVIIGGCPSCRAGVLEDEYSCLAIFCAIFFFPIGILCCLAMRERRCTNCRAQF